jgi:hypothetical protein
MENKRGFHVTIVENKTGETLEEFDTKGMVYVHMSEVAEEDMPEKTERQVGVQGICVGQKMEGVNPMEQMSILEGLQMLTQSMQDNPLIQLLMLITETERREVNKEAAKEAEDKDEQDD